MPRFIGRCLKAGILAACLGVPGMAVPAFGEQSPPTLELQVHGTVKTGQSMRFSGSGQDTSATQQYLTVFLTPPRVHGCPAIARAPKGADRVLSREPVDNFLSITDFSDDLNIPGRWHLCGYLTESSSAVTSSSNVAFMVRRSHSHKIEKKRR